VKRPGSLDAAMQKEAERFSAFLGRRVILTQM
jgi:hypothetical protein